VISLALLKHVQNMAPEIKVKMESAQSPIAPFVDIELPPISFPEEFPLGYIGVSEPVGGNSSGILAGELHIW